MQYDVITSPGSRAVNEDSTGVTENQEHICFVVADGLGGHGGGDVASRLAVQAFDTVFSAGDGRSQSELLFEAFLQAQADILQEQRGTPSQRKPTAAHHRPMPLRETRSGSGPWITAFRRCWFFRGKFAKRISGATLTETGFSGCWGPRRFPRSLNCRSRSRWAGFKRFCCAATAFGS